MKSYSLRCASSAMPTMLPRSESVWCYFFFQAEDGIRDHCVTGVQTCALPISRTEPARGARCTDSLEPAVRADAGAVRAGARRGALLGRHTAARQRAHAAVLSRATRVFLKPARASCAGRPRSQELQSPGARICPRSAPPASTGVAMLTYHLPASKWPTSAALMGASSVDQCPISTESLLSTASLRPVAALPTCAASASSTPVELT